MKSRRETETEREFQICAAEKPLLVKILFEEASFEGGEGRAVTESERKRIPYLGSREAKGTTTMLFSFEERDAGSYEGQVQPDNGHLDCSGAC